MLFIKALKVLALGLVFIFVTIFFIVTYLVFFKLLKSVMYIIYLKVLFTYFILRLSFIESFIITNITFKLLNLFFKTIKVKKGWRGSKKVNYIKKFSYGDSFTFIFS